VHLDF